MRFLAVLLLVIFSFSPLSMAYPQDQLKECIFSAKQNPNVEGVSEVSIENYCDCALQLIIDEGKDVRDSGYECASKHFE